MPLVSVISAFERGLTQACLVALWVYQRTLSPAFAAFGVRCRHMPSCSHYSCAAYRRHGFWVGSWLTLSRLMRCHPWGSHGYDPIPQECAPQGWRFWRYGDWGWHGRDRDKNDASISDVKLSD